MSKSYYKVRGCLRDSEIYEFLWRWKAATTMAIATRFFPSAVTAYHRLQKLKQAGDLERHVLDAEGKEVVWTITDRRYSSLRQRIGEFENDGFRSENAGHDLYVTAVHLGDWLVKEPESVEFFSEQELRRNYRDWYPDWVPQDFSHRPDGYWLIPHKGNLVTVALEVELTYKKPSEYSILAHRYKYCPKIFRVIWVTKTRALAKHIRSIFSNEAADHVSRHNFILLEDFRKKSWGAEIVFGEEAGKTLRSFMSEGGQKPVSSTWDSMSNPFLDTRRYPTDPTPCMPLKNSEFVDCMAL